MANPNVQTPSMDEDFLRLIRSVNEDTDATLLRPLIDSITAIRKMINRLTPDELKGIFADTRPDLEIRLESLIETTLPDNICREIMGRVAIFMFKLKNQQTESENPVSAMEPDLRTHGHQRVPSSPKSPVTPPSKKTAPKSTESRERPKTLDEQYEIAMRELKDMLNINSDFSSMNQDTKEAIKYGAFMLLARSMKPEGNPSKADVEALMDSLEHRKSAATALAAVFKVSLVGARGFIARVDGSAVKGRTILRSPNWLEKLKKMKTATVKVE